MKLSILILFALVLPLLGEREEKASTAKERELIEAAYRLRVKDVQRLIAEGADVNVRYGKHEADEKFQDPWDLGYPMAYSNWTPLLALSQASIWPPPPRKIENTEEDFEFRLKEAAKVPEKELEERRELKLQIGKILIDAGANVNVDDGVGATPLYNCAAGESGLLLLLVQHSAQVNSTTGIYIDGPGNKTPLHLAIHSIDNLAALIHEGASLDAVDTNGNTALHRAVQADKLAAVKMLLDAGANRTIKNKDGKMAVDLCNTHEWASVIEVAISRLFAQNNKKHNKSEQGNR